MVLHSLNISNSFDYLVKEAVQSSVNSQFGYDFLYISEISLTNWDFLTSSKLILLNERFNNGNKWFISSQSLVSSEFLSFKRTILQKHEGRFLILFLKNISKKSLFPY